MTVTEPETFDSDAFDPDADRLREECGVFGIFGHPDAAAITALTMASRSSSRSFSASIVILCRVPFAGPAGFPD